MFFRVSVVENIIKYPANCWIIEDNVASESVLDHEKLIPATKKFWSLYLKNSLPLFVLKGLH